MKLVEIFTIPGYNGVIYKINRAVLEKVASNELSIKEYPELEEIMRATVGAFLELRSKHPDGTVARTYEPAKKKSSRRRK